MPERVRTAIGRNRAAKPPEIAGLPAVEADPVHWGENVVATDSRVPGDQARRSCRPDDRRRASRSDVDPPRVGRPLRSGPVSEPRGRAWSAGRARNLFSARDCAGPRPAAGPGRPAQASKIGSRRGPRARRNGRGDRRPHLEPWVPDRDGRAVPALPVRRPGRCPGLGPLESLAAACREPDALPECPGGLRQLQREAALSARRDGRAARPHVGIPNRVERSCRPLVGGGSPRRSAPSGQLSGRMPGRHRRLRGVVVGGAARSRRIDERLRSVRPDPGTSVDAPEVHRPRAGPRRVDPPAVSRLCRRRREAAVSPGGGACS
jgi:hypothetical protein